jgi:hypothetical protein
MQTGVGTPLRASDCSSKAGACEHLRIHHRSVSRCSPAGMPTTLSPKKRHRVSRNAAEGSKTYQGLYRYESSSEPSKAPIFIDQAPFGRVEFIIGCGLVAEAAELWVALQ